MTDLASGPASSDTRHVTELWPADAAETRRTNGEGRHRMPQAWENSPRRLLLHTWVLTARILRRWSRDVSTMTQSLAMPVVLLITINIVFDDGVSAVTGESALYGSVPLIAMIGTMTGAITGAIGVMRERDDGLLSRLWVMPVHRGAGLLSRLAADAIRIFVTTLVIMAAGMVMGFRFEQGLLSAVAWAFIPVIFGMAFSVVVFLLALYSANTIAVEATDLLAATTMFFCTGLVPLSQYPDWIQPVVEHQPVSYVVETMRGLSIGGPVLQPFLGTVAWSVGIIAVCAVPLALGYRRASMR
ncbi:peptide ABC transporter permease [Mycolicibacterium duvalii]|uniref:Transport permease protein n=2 Tax=Mycolicibacterium duvalii TaxID=39688 RepID=A0A7I7JYP5_9MYCO|nr:ABC transporter permease [Mycolicibacterium duvalii]PEG37995.1 peptide ABC transporter permease [Mycolicibacterium duvalii]BBX16448.1 putative doxorubicin resistance ABC transporter permease protein DrrC [Mycolicibacterium duvalii]